ncbi:hypothetical protein C8F04DRAFT_1301629, partial [Mycena alexandri]
MRGAYLPLSLLFYFASRPRLPPSPSFLSSSPPSRTPPHTRAVKSSADGTRFRLPVLRADALVCAPSPRAALHHPVYPSPSSSHPHPPHQIHPSSSRIRTRRTRAHCQVDARWHQLPSAQIRIRRGRSCACASSPRAPHRKSCSHTGYADSCLHCAARHRALALLSPPAPHRTSSSPPTHHLLPYLYPHPPSPSSPALAPPHTFCPRLALGAACGMRAVCVDGVPARGPAGVARAECALRRLRTLDTAV